MKCYLDLRVDGVIRGLPLMERSVNAPRRAHEVLKTLPPAEPFLFYM